MYDTAWKIRNAHNGFHNARRASGETARITVTLYAITPFYTATAVSRRNEQTRENGASRLGVRADGAKPTGTPPGDRARHYALTV